MYLCKCLQNFISPKSLQDHAKSTGHCFYCSHCNAFFNSGQELDNHNSSLHPFFCRTCKKTFPLLQGLKRHQRAKEHCYCQRCDRYFVDEQGLKAHRVTSHEFFCQSCSKGFSSRRKLHGHQRSAVHCYCQECNQFFPSEQSLKAHCEALHKHPCPTCEQLFKTFELLRNHQRSKAHCYCQECDRYFFSFEAITQHLESSIHASQFHCCDCDRDFVDQQTLEQHLRDKIHELEQPDPESFECRKCEREFKDKHALNQHLASVVHKPLSNIKCVASSKCKARFTSPSALLHHLESGGCRSGMNRKKLNQLVQRSDIERIISSGLEESDFPVTTDNGPDPASSINYPSLTPLSSGYSTPIQTPSSDEDSGVPLPFGFDGVGDEISLPSGLLTPRSGLSLSNLIFHPMMRRITCPLCPSNGITFGPTMALQTHLASPKHAPKNFHCPTNLLSLNLDGGTEPLIKNFSTLSGLTQHIESGACHGGDTTLKRAIEFVEKRLVEMGFQNIKLLK